MRFGWGHSTARHPRSASESPKHSEAIKKRCDEVGVPAVLVLPRADAKAAPPEEASLASFLFKHLGVGAAPKKDVK